MSDIFKAECRRFLAWAGVYALLHLGALVFLARVVDLAQQPPEVYYVFGAVYALTQRVAIPQNAVGNRCR